MANEVTLPGVGKVKKSYAIAGGIGVVVLAVIWYRQKKSASAAAGGTPAGTGMVTDPAGNVCSALNPASGYCPGTAQDMAYQANQLGYGGSAYGGGGGGYSYGTGASPSGTGTTPGPGSFTNNAEWASYCESVMGSNGSDAVAAALGKYLTGNQITTTQATIVDEAIAVGGYPPTNGPGGRPPGLNVTSPGGGGGGGSNLITVPDLAGQSAGQAHNALLALGLVPVAPPSQKANYKVWYTNPRAGSKVSRGTHVTIDTKGIV
jgi:hypothetical protein